MIYVFLAFLVLLIDQATMYYVVTHFLVGEITTLYHYFDNSRFLS